MEVVKNFKEDVDLILGSHYPPSKTRDQVREMLHERIEYHITHVSQQAVQADAIYDPVCSKCGDALITEELLCDECRGIRTA